VIRGPAGSAATVRAIAMLPLGYPKVGAFRKLAKIILSQQYWG